jgi:hypothetical protein
MTASGQMVCERVCMACKEIKTFVNTGDKICYECLRLSRREFIKKTLEKSK